MGLLVYTGRLSSGKYGKDHFRSCPQHPDGHQLLVDDVVVFNHLDG